MFRTNEFTYLFFDLSNFRAHDVLAMIKHLKDIGFYFISNSFLLSGQVNEFHKDFLLQFFKFDFLKSLFWALKLITFQVSFVNAVNAVF